MEPNKTLMIFDFDQTIVDEDSTIQIINLLDNSEFHENDLSNKHRNNKWVDYIQDLFNRLNKQKVDVSKLQNIFCKIKVTKGFVSLLDYVTENENLYETIILSNSNNLFISWFVTERKFLVKEIIANKAEIVTNTFIKIWNDQKSTCTYCPDLCKKMSLEEFIKNNKYKKLIYVGDGSNDYCPALVLQKDDYLFVRKNYPLHGMLSSSYSTNIVSKELKCNICLWDDGNSILQELKKLFT